MLPRISELLQLIQAAILGIGALHFYWSMNAWWLRHPRLSNGMAAFVPATVMIVAWVMAMSPFWWWGTLNWGMILLCYVPLLACGAFHIAVWTRAARQAIHDGEEFVEEKFDEIKHKLGIDNYENAAGEKSDSKPAEQKTSRKFREWVALPSVDH